MSNKTKLEQIVDDHNLSPWKWKIFLDYEDYFNRFLSYKSFKLMEIGVFKGESVKLWDIYFSSIAERTIVGVDTQYGSINNSTIRTYIGSQTDTRFLDAIIAEHGKFDIIIDDGSHINEDQKKTFEYLYPYVNDGGLYIVEDIYSSYHGKWIKNDDDRKKSFIEYMKNKVNDLNSYWNTDNNWPPKGELSQFEKETKSINFHDSFLVVQKRSEIMLKHQLIRGTV